MKLPLEVFNIIVDLRVRHTDLAVGNDDARRKLTLMMAETIRTRLGPRWGTKAQSRTHPQSKDSIAYLYGDESMDIWDWQNGQDRSVQVRPWQEPTHTNVVGQYFIKVDPIDHLAGGIPTPNPPTSQEEAWTKKLEEIRAHQEEMKGQIEALRNRAVDLLHYIMERQDRSMTGDVNMGWLGRPKITLDPTDQK